MGKRAEGAGDIFGGAGAGAMTGASMGSPFGPVGIGVGGFLGGAVGGISGFFKAKAKQKQKQSVADARIQLEELARTQRAQRMADMQRAMSYFQPVQQEIDRLYG